MKVQYIISLILSIILILFSPFLLAHNIIDKPITFTEKRVALTREYRKKHYGFTTKSIEIIPKMIVIHWTAIDTLKKSFNAFNREELHSNDRAQLSNAGSLNVSAHFLVDKDGTIYRLMPETIMARHVIGLNAVSIGIENVGGCPPNHYLTQQQLDANSFLVKYLKKKYPTIKYLIGHYEYRDYEYHKDLWLEQDPNYRNIKVDPGSTFMYALRGTLSP